MDHKKQKPLRYEGLSGGGAVHKAFLRKPAEKPKPAKLDPFLLTSFHSKTVRCPSFGIA